MSERNPAARAALLALGLAAATLALAGCKGKSAEEEAAARGEPTAPSSEWVEPNPTEPAVPVTVPDTPMTMTPEPAPTSSPS